MKEARAEEPGPKASPPGVDALSEWRSGLTGATGAMLLFETLTGLAIYLLAFSLFNQFNVLLHTVVGLAMLGPVTWFLVRHWLRRKQGRLSHYQLLGYLALGLLLVCVLSGLVLTWQGIFGPRIGYAWDRVHLVAGIGMGLFIAIHLVAIVVRPTLSAQVVGTLRGARRRFYLASALGCAAMVFLAGLGAYAYQEPALTRGFEEDYNWRFGEDRPFAPSLARLDDRDASSLVREQVLDVIGPEREADYRAAFERWKREPVGLVAQVRNSVEGLGLGSEQSRRLEQIFTDYVNRVRAAGAVYPRVLAGSAGCGASGCHQEIYREWLPSAHRYSSLDHMFQRVQALMVEETAPEFTRYCAGCHDPVSLFSGAKDPGNVTLSVEGSNEGASCVICHSMVRTDIQGNGDYTIRPPHPYAFEWDRNPVPGLLGDFLIRVYPWQHVANYSRPLLRKPEFCAACHKQYVDREVNVDIGKVQGQNQFDSWKNSRWYHDGDPARTVTCRECHMPLTPSSDPARGDARDYNRSPDDGRHRSHRTLASNQYIPVDQDLEGAREHVALTEQWLRGELEIPEIADKWTTGPVVRMQLVAPERASPGEEVRVQVVLNNNKTGHDFPTGPLDMIESWVELEVTNSGGDVVYHVGGLESDGRVSHTTPVVFKADGFDRKGELIDRHNLWDLVGASYKRALYPGVTDAVAVGFQCPSMARGRISQAGQPSGRRSEGFAFAAPAAGADALTVRARLWYRKANPDFLDRIYGAEPRVRSPLTEMSTAAAVIRVESDAD